MKLRDLFSFVSTKFTDPMFVADRYGKTIFFPRSRTDSHGYVMADAKLETEARLFYSSAISIYFISLILSAAALFYFWIFLGLFALCSVTLLTVCNLYARRITRNLRVSKKTRKEIILDNITAASSEADSKTSA